jgi:diguanylate cyclase (GGDEF)-like protein
VEVDDLHPLSAMKAKLPDSELSRLAALRRYEILDTVPEQAYDDITQLISQICRVPIALVSLTDGDRQWFKSKVGLDVSEIARDFAFCAHALQRSDEILTVNDALLDARFADNPLVTGEPHIRFYAGAPLVTPDGQTLGTLCVIDTVPRELNHEQEEALRVLARQVMAQFELRYKVAELEHSAAEQQRYERRLEQYQKKLKETIAELEVQTVTDDLTGLKNRRAFQQRLDEEFQRAMRYNTPLSLLMMDVDKFKSYNDTFGHPAGDEVLQTLARLLQTGLRVSDCAARYGGEEFAIILPNTGGEYAQLLAERARRRIAAGPWPNKVVTVSIGVSALTPAMAGSGALVSEADKARYHAKQSGRNRVAVASELQALEGS